MILKDHKRPDGRADHTDPSSGCRSRYYSESTWFRNVYPWTDSDLQRHVRWLLCLRQQKLDGLDENEVAKRYMHHYNFPSYSVGETKPSRGPGRREIGHGALAEKALMPGTSFVRRNSLMQSVPYPRPSNPTVLPPMASICASCTVPDGSRRSDQEAWLQVFPVVWLPARPMMIISYSDRYPGPGRLLRRYGLQGNRYHMTVSPQSRWISRSTV